MATSIEKRKTCLIARTKSEEGILLHIVIYFDSRVCALGKCDAGDGHTKLTQVSAKAVLSSKGGCTLQLDDTWCGLVHIRLNPTIACTKFNVDDVVNDIIKIISDEMSPTRV